MAGTRTGMRRAGADSMGAARIVRGTIFRAAVSMVFVGWQSLTGARADQGRGEFVSRPRVKALGGDQEECGHAAVITAADDDDEMKRLAFRQLGRSST